MDRDNSATVTSKGQLVIPAHLRRQHGIRKGTTVVFHEDGVRLILQPITDAFIRSLKGSLKPKKGQRSMLETLYEMRRQDRVL